MVIYNGVLDKLSNKAKEMPRLRMNYDLRNTSDDNSQRILNTPAPITVMPIHQHHANSETVKKIKNYVSI